MLLSLVLSCMLWYTIQAKMCIYGDAMFDPGPVYLETCVACMCDGITGQLTCSHMSCPPSDDPACVRYEIPPGQCCPVCVQYGCMYDGQPYMRGERIQLDPCRYCYCPWEGEDAKTGLVSCVNMTCVDMGCPGGMYVPDRCCPVCPGYYFDEWTYELGYDDDIVPYGMATGY